MEELSSGNYTNEEINRAAWEYQSFCIDDGFNLSDEYLSRPEGEIIAGSPSSHIYEVMEILLGFGMDPNYIYDDGEDSNIISEMRYVANGYLGADTAALLLEHGGNPNLRLNGASLIHDTDFGIMMDLMEHDFRYGLDAYIHFWKVLLGYGAVLTSGEEVVERVNDFDIAKLKNHREYTFGISYSNNGKEGCVSIFDKKSHLEVAKYQSWWKHIG